MMEEIRFEHVSFHYPETDTVIFQDLNLSLLPGITTFVGPNGVGKSTLLLLAAGILLPDTGTVSVQGIDTRLLRDELERQRYVSFIYQNMEFETEESVGNLLHIVNAQGFRDNPDKHLAARLVKEFELEKVLTQKTQEISKGELQRTILAFSLLYGSRILIMDEPIFAMENPQKYRAMQFLTEFARHEHISIYYSAHELDISTRFSDYVLLFQANLPPMYGRTSDLLTREHLERVYEVPLSYLKQRETLYRATLMPVPKEHSLN